MSRLVGGDGVTLGDTRRRDLYRRRRFVVCDAFISHNQGNGADVVAEIADQDGTLAGRLFYECLDLFRGDVFVAV